MENKDWLNEHEVLKQVNANNPFTVPSGYFSDLSERILSLKNLHNLKIEKDGFTVPENYFDELSGNINSRITVAAALNAGDAAFAIPPNYFDELSGNIQSRIAIEEAAGEDMGFEVPQGYFENLQQQITARIAVEEALNDMPEETFAVPSGYFDKLNAAILDKTVNARPEEVVTTVEEQPVQRRGIVRRMFASTAYKYAAAACVTVVAGVSFFLASNNGNSNGTTGNQHAATYLHTQLADIPVTEIRNYVQQNIDAGDTQSMIQVKDINEEEILDYIDTEL